MTYDIANNKRYTNPDTLAAKTMRSIRDNRLHLLHIPLTNSRNGKMTPEDIQARVLYRDALVLIIDKPAGLPVHAGPGGGPNLEQSFDALRFGLQRPPALVHRLDRDTSGCLVLGRHPKALRKAGMIFAAGRAEKTYWAVVHGAPPQDAGVIDLALKKETPKRGWKMIVSADGQRSETHYKVRGRSGDLTWLELTPRTGRTHQIRVHCAALGFPVVGDPLYGAAPPTQPLMLHARAISLPLYPSRPPIAAVAAPPSHMAELLRSCGWKSD